MKKALLPAEARKRWHSSTVVKPVARCRAVCDKHPTLSYQEQVALCVKAGVSHATAKVICSKWRTARAKGQK